MICVLFILPFLLSIRISDFSYEAKIFYFTPSGEGIWFNYICNTTELLLGPNNQQYEINCYPKYNTNQTFFAPKNQDAATILCKTSATILWGITWAIPCNSQIECDDGSDEFGCEFPTWLIPSILSGAGSLLCISLFVYLHHSIKSTWKKKMRYRKSRFSIQRSHPSIEAEKLYKIAVLVESGDVDKVCNMYCLEVENIGGEGEATCHLKVCNRTFKQSFKVTYTFR